MLLEDAPLDLLYRVIWGLGWRDAEGLTVAVAGLQSAKCFYRRDVYESVGVVKGHPCGDEFVTRGFFHRIFLLADQGSLPLNPAVVLLHQPSIRSERRP
jgi:hypothetical protein